MMLSGSRLVSASLAFAVIAALPALLRAADVQKFEFGTTTPAAGFTAVGTIDNYTAARGYGFEDAAAAKVVDRGAPGPHFITADKPFNFHVKEPEGNYRVTITAGDSAGPTDLTVKAELRRLMVEHLHLDAGKTQSVSFVVNVRVPQFPGGTVKLKAPRESVDEAWAWDDKLTLEFNNAHPNVQSVVIEKVDVPTVYLVGDSTMCDQSKEPWSSWGQTFPRFFKEDVAIANHAESGETVASSLGANRFAKVYSLLKKGDYVFWAYGHNDMKGGNINTYIADYKKIIAEVKSRGATPVIVSSMERSNGADKNTLAGYPDAAKQVAADEKVAFIDLHAMSQQLYKGIGPTDLHLLFSYANGKQDGTHNNDFGSFETSKLVLEGVRQLKLDLVSHIKDGVPVFDPSRPDKPADFKLPLSTKWDGTRPLGD